MRKMDKWFAGAPLYWFLLGALWCAAAVVSLWEGRAPVGAVPLFAAAAIQLCRGRAKMLAAKQAQFLRSQNNAKIGAG